MDKNKEQAHNEGIFEEDRLIHIAWDKDTGSIRFTFKSGLDRTVTEAEMRDYLGFMDSLIIQEWDSRTMNDNVSDDPLRE